MSRFLVDENLSPALAEALRADGHDAIHVTRVGLGHRPDEHILAWAGTESRTVLTADHDFHDHLFTGGGSGPSVVRLSQRGADGLAGTAAQAARLRTLLPALEPYLATGIAVSVDHRRIRISPLPLERRLPRLPPGRQRGEPPQPARDRGLTRR